MFQVLPMKHDNVSYLVSCISSPSVWASERLSEVNHSETPHTHPSLLQILCTTHQAQRRNLPGNSLHIASGLAVLSMDQQGMTSVIQALTLLAPRVCSSVQALHLWGAHRSHRLQHVSSAWAPLLHSFSTVNMKQMPAFNSGVHFFGMLVSVLLPLQCFFMRGSLVILCV